MEQRAIYPEILAELVKQIRYKPDWVFELRHEKRDSGSEGLTLCILIKEFDSYAPEKGRNYRVMHYFPVIPATYNERSWKRWLFDQILLVEQHEAAEFFMIGDDRPYAPYHHAGNNPYTIFELNNEEESELGRHR